MPDPKTLDQFDIRGRIDDEGAAREAQRLVGEGHEARFGVCDVADLEPVAAVFDDHGQAFGGCDIVFGRTGVEAPRPTPTPLPLQRAQRPVRVNRQSSRDAMAKGV